MWTYIVTWCLSNLILAPCPDAIKADQFGRKGSIISCSVLHYDIEEDCNYKKSFYNRKPAIIFYDKVAKESNNPSGYFNQTINNIKIDSTWTSQY